MHLDALHARPRQDLGRASGALAAVAREAENGVPDGEEPRGAVVLAEPPRKESWTRRVRALRSC